MKGKEKKRGRQGRNKESRKKRRQSRGKRRRKKKRGICQTQLTQDPIGKEFESVLWVGVGERDETGRQIIHVSLAFGSHL